jgi:hypothetical protein
MVETNCTARINIGKHDGQLKGFNWYQFDAHINDYRLQVTPNIARELGYDLPDRDIESVALPVWGYGIEQVCVIDGQVPEHLKCDLRWYMRQMRKGER